MNEYNNPHEISWDDEISSDDSQYIILEEGDYNFTVTNFERGRFPGSAKLPACNKAALTLAVETPEGTAFIKYDLILWSSLEWKISEFFRAIGQKKHGEKFVPRWNAVIGAKGRGALSPAPIPRKTVRKEKPMTRRNSTTSTPISSLGSRRPVPQLPQRPTGWVNSNGAASGAASISAGSHCGDPEPVAVREPPDAAGTPHRLRENDCIL